MLQAAHTESPLPVFEDSELASLSEDLIAYLVIQQSAESE
jgi:hypothetical protein